MKIRSKAFNPAPNGTFPGIVIDVVDLGIQPTPYGDKPKISFVFQLDTGGDLRDDGKPHTVATRYTPSLHEKSKLRRDLVSLLGRSLSASEVKEFDTEQLMGKTALLSVVRVERGDKTFANIQTLMPLPKSMAAPVPRTDYVRVCNRPAQGQQSTPRQSAARPTVARASAQPPAVEPGDFDITDSDVPY